MPFLRFTGFEKDFLQELAPVLIEQFSDIANVPKEIIKIERLHVDPIANSPQSVEIQMFQREQETHNALAMMLHQLLHARGATHAHLYFVILTPSLYYKEGIPLKEIPRRVSEVR
ncbi:DUF1904 family protein [Tumebacillus permanentifrigoris]|uniref:Uncharacterized protein DUF1904 n=1 Tax=Tumebacillus permanentifrigoris TaxID=378543 RepID=A0A316D9F0_9BACL|nr:DUF1904 family protein [Tumebacillus permanentifrigoris]PWK11562.1 uncharacterized protein DUF1904 [Tumebacillus permanentifrigoris]